MRTIFRGWRGRLAPAAAMLCLVVAVCPVDGADADRGAPEKARVRLRFRIAEALYDPAPVSFRRLARIEAEREKLKSALDALDAGAEKNSAPRRGLREEAYISALDDSAQPFLRYLPETSPTVTGLPLLVYLHGYSPDLTLFNWQGFSPALTNLAERMHCALVMPFGRSNTDFQGIGEQDVLRTIDEMSRRYRVDTRRVILIGYSMGGMGAWTLGARFAERFAGVMTISARGDYYAWHRLSPERLPAWRRRLVDHAFAPRHLSRMANLPVCAFHGQEDPLVPPREALAIYEQAREHNPAVRLRVLKGESHWIDDRVLRSSAAREWLRERLAEPPPAAARPAPLGIVPGQTPSRLQNAFLSPFVFVAAGGGDEEAWTGPVAGRLLMERAREWRRYAKAWPRMKFEETLQPEDFVDFNLFVFAEPEDSVLVRDALRTVGGAWDAETFTLGGRALPRRDHGLWLAAPSPYAPGRTLVVQCGRAWGPGLPDNHRYDMLPDVMVYAGDETDPDGFPKVISAGYVDEEGTVAWGDGSDE